MDDETKKKIIENYLSTQEGRTKLAKSMLQPIRQRRDYQGLGRKLLGIEQLPGFHCAKCGLWNEDENYAHPNEECVVNEVLET